MDQLSFHKPDNAPPPISFTDQLPILEKAVGAYKQWHGYFQHLPRLTRYSLGAKIDTLFTDVIELILNAGYATKDKKELLVSQASVKLDALKFFLRVAWELKALDHHRFQVIGSLTVEIGKMLGGWRKQLLNKTPGSPGAS
ncbi:MAG: four helix bundle protein [bacterium]